jgi:hypothetical protein
MALATPDSGHTGLFPDSTYVSAIEHATEISSHPHTWIHPETGMKLIPSRWHHHGETATGAVGLVDWAWQQAPPPPTDHANHASALAHRTKLGEQLDEAARMGMLEGCPEGIEIHTFVSNVLPLAAVVKSTGKVRMIVDPTLGGINDAMATLPCMLTSVEDIFRRTSHRRVLAKRDLLNGFFHLVLSTQARTYMGVRHPVTGDIKRWVVLPQGTKQSPALFCAVTEASCRIYRKLFELQAVDCNISVYVDDYILDAGTAGDLERAFQITDTEASNLGLTWNPNKDIGRNDVLHELEALGLLINTDSMTLSLPADKRDAYLSELESFVATYSNQRTCPRKTLEQLLGKLTFTCRVCRWGYLFTQAFLDTLYPAFSLRTRHVRLTNALWQDAAFWREALGPAYDTWLGVQQHMLPGTLDVKVVSDQYKVQIFSDASKRFGAGGVMGPDEIYSHQWTRDTSEEHIGSLELEAVYLNLKHWKDKLRGQNVLVWVDNTQALSAINKGTSRIPALRKTLLNIALLGLASGFHVRAQYVPGEENPADAPSRGREGSQDFRFLNFEDWNTPPAELDIFPASWGSAPGCAPLAINLPALERNIAMQGKTVWACPPFSCVGQLLDEVYAAWLARPLTTRATIVVPEWPTASWYRKYLRRRQQIFRLLHRYPANTPLFAVGNRTEPCQPCQHPMLVIRLGSESL